MSDDFTKIVFPIIRREAIPDPYAGEQCCYEPGVCMRLNCGLPRWHDPEKGETVLCEDHAREVYEKKAKAPPLIPTFVPPMPDSIRYPRGAVFYLDYANTQSSDDGEKNSSK